eukprot:COSAG02_NODE_3820_length_6190_cov_1.860121_8_plen_85_part_00
MRECIHSFLLISCWGYTLQKELHDRASDPACADTLQQLSARLFDGWDPVVITARAAERKNEAQLLGKWQGNVKPEQTHVWRIEP